MQWWDWMPRFKFFKCWVSNIQIYMYCIINYSHILYLSPSGLITGSLYHLISFTYINSYFLKKLHLLSYHLLSHCSSLSKFSAPTFLSRPCLFPLHPFHILSFHILLDNWNFSIVLFRSFWLIPLLDSRLLVYILLCRMIVSNSELDLVGYSPWGLEELDTTEGLHFHFSLPCIGEGNGNPLQCSCLENPRDSRAWWTAAPWTVAYQALPSMGFSRQEY